MTGFCPAVARAFAVLLLLASLVSCGGGGGGGGGGGSGQPLTIAAGAANDGYIGGNYSFIVTATGGSGNRDFSISAGNVPAGLSLNPASGQIAGVPTGPAAVSSFTVRVVDSGTPQQNDTQTFSIEITEPLILATVTLPGATIGASYNQTLVATGGTAPYTFQITGASGLPAGLSLNPNGAISGTPVTTAVTQSFTMQVTDSSSPNFVNSRPLIIAIALEITTTSLPDATVAEVYDEPLEARGGQPPYGNWARVAGSMPPGIGDPIPNSGIVTGTPESVCAPVTSTFTAQVRDSASPPVFDTQAGLSITVRPGPLVITTQSLPNGVVGIPYNAAVQVSGGAPPYNFTTSGTLPSQLGPIHSTQGLITGTPDTVESRTFSAIVTDSCGVTDSQSLTITINAAAAGRNDSAATATVLTNGSFSASISPSGDPSTVFAPDVDYYRITTTAASTITVDINAQVNGSPMDSVIEFVTFNGVPLMTCVSPAFTSVCIHDDEQQGVTLDSFLQIRVNGPTTFYLHVLEWRYDGRPDLLYTMNVSGIN